MGYPRTELDETLLSSQSHGQASQGHKHRHEENAAAKETEEPLGMTQKQSA